MVQVMKKNYKKKVNVYFIGDMHLGSKTFAKKEFEKVMNTVKNDKLAAVILMGDMGDFIESDDSRRYDPACIDKTWNTAELQYQAIKNYMKPIKDKIIGVVRGNHESAFAKYHKEQFTLSIRDHAERLAKDLKVKYLEDMGIINLVVDKKKFTVVVAHGCGSSATLSGQIMSLNKMINSFEITPDVACIGHVHALQTIVNPKMNFNFVTKIKHLGLSGNFYKTYLKGNVNYASSMLYNPLPIGCIMYSFDNKGDIVDNKLIMD